MIRLAEEKDVDIIQKIMMIFYFCPKVAIKENIMRKQLYLEEDNNEIRGMILWGRKFDRICDLIVLEKYRGQGIGKQLFNETVKILNPEYIKLLASTIPIDSRGFWQSLGFSFINKGKEFLTKTTKSGKVLFYMEKGKEKTLW